ncbi:MAG: hypothetical protein CO186_09230 [Zetaproteobacteria bacterium CG_4_9_14_3_um_filter_49_83]|nr:MAG: hypothetical protein AUJ56_10935 [Zetaproteobacteria bacterium CG1_02_49_23]PIQ33539.1 MAG: hypothetical protein COW62_04905 [Zetaproteobacteria bacterium CG17_big_fil_post_rev_8_21_14_2_50_50_13]PIV29584.1 MAG: hypothetical protein COS35_11230 [Zetaproteobacteria bacterium CG02_land_8_20_14_3_00_50_9]PIY56367.1 MAG: hypothetical protein COZ00_04600 [Zetaproteobacteria bacterium CG_4_10_14_0_8_um_filter_49_80]PJA34764.1 MAG: hypothetical protein CO186_09230 [Zetaproteobacteria bacterium
MNDAWLVALAATLEIGTPIGLTVGWFQMPGLRKRIVVILGAVTPLLMAYTYTTVKYVVLNQEDAAWGFYAMWVMSFVPYLACMMIGLILGLLKRPNNQFIRYMIGFLASGAVVGALVAN